MGYVPSVEILKRNIKYDERLYEYTKHNLPFLLGMIVLSIIFRLLEPDIVFVGVFNLCIGVIGLFILADVGYLLTKKKEH